MSASRSKRLSGPNLQLGLANEQDTKYGPDQRADLVCIAGTLKIRRELKACTNEDSGTEGYGCWA
jgi:hypothetical protein